LQLIKALPDGGAVVSEQSAVRKKKHADRIQFDTGAGHHESPAIRASLRGRLRRLLGAVGTSAQL
jgi:hypothetical protein